MSSESYHESTDLLSPGTKDLHRAIVSLKEELDAVDWYQQRAEACTDDELRTILIHNRNEEIEHAMMVLEWLRRKDAVFATNIDSYIDSTGPIIDVEKRTTDSERADGAGRGGQAQGASASLGIGSLKGMK